MQNSYHCSPVELSDYVKQDATGLAAAISAGQLSQGEAVGAARRAVEAVEPRLNATVGEAFEEPLAYDPAGALAGVPFALKDLRPHAAGVPSQFGSRLGAAGFTPPEDSHLMGRFRAAGLASICRTSTPEVGFNATTEPVAGGPTRSPWDLDRSAGGSSGGAAALVAARALPVAHASDGGGSIRIPAACCGLVGLKPTRGRTPVGPQGAEPLAGLAIEFVVSRTVRDTAGLLDALHGPGVGDKFAIAPPEEPYANEVGKAPRQLRVAFSAQAWSGPPVDAACAAAVEATAGEIAELGHAVESGSPQIDGEALHQAHVDVWAAVIAQNILFYATALGMEPGPDTLEATTLAMLEHGRSVGALAYLAGLDTYNAVSRASGAFFEDVDVLVTPTIASLPALIAELDQNDASLDADGWVRKVFTYAPFTAVFNVTGQPAISLPLGWSEQGLPVGVQLVARSGDEATLIRLASQLEDAMPWRDRVPPVVAG